MVRLDVIVSACCVSVEVTYKQVRIAVSRYPTC